MSYADVRHWYEDPPDEQDLKDAEIRALKQFFIESLGIDTEALQDLVDRTAELEDRELLRFCHDVGSQEDLQAYEEWKLLLNKLRTPKRPSMEAGNAPTQEK